MSEIAFVGRNIYSNERSWGVLAMLVFFFIGILLYINKRGLMEDPTETFSHSNPQAQTNPQNMGPIPSHNTQNSSQCDVRPSRRNKTSGILSHSG